jgi:hypothetical protein
MNGGLYAAFYIVRDKNEIAERQVRFREALRPWIEDFLETDEVEGCRMRRFSDFAEPYWLEDPATPIGLVKDYVVRGTGRRKGPVGGTHPACRQSQFL